MGLLDIFKNNGGATYDGQGDEPRGLIDVVRYNGEPDDLLWRFPYDNLSTRTQLVVQEGQEAVFFSGGRLADVFGPGTKTLSTNNIPILQKLINLPFGGESPFKASVTYVNTVNRIENWGVGGFDVADFTFGSKRLMIKVGGYGNLTMRIVDSPAFIRSYGGTSHHITSGEFSEQFCHQIEQYLKPVISKFFDQQRISITQINNYLIEIAQYAQNELNKYFERFGVEITDFAVGGINASKDNPNYKLIQEAQAKQLEYETYGTSYQQSRQLDIMQTAAGNEGSAGSMMGAGMGLGMGLGMGGMFGQQMGQVAGVMNPAATNVPPPMPGAVSYHVYINNVQQGPYQMAQLQQLAMQGQLTPATLVWKAGMPTWAAASTCPDLAVLFTPATPPVPPSMSPTPPSMPPTV